MKNWGKCLHESQTIWDMCVCVCVCVCACGWWGEGSKGKQSTSLSNSSAVDPPYSKIFHASGHQKTKQKFINWWNHEESILSNKTTFIISLAPKDITAPCHNLAAQ